MCLWEEQRVEPQALAGLFNDLKTKEKAMDEEKLAGGGQELNSIMVRVYKSSRDSNVNAVVVGERGASEFRILGLI